MKQTIIPFGLVAMLMMASCGDDKGRETEVENAEALAAASREELETALAERDQLLELVNGITAGMEEIKQLENILSINNSGETGSDQAKIKSDIAAIKATLEQRRIKLDELEKKLSNSNLNNANLRKTIASLKSQIDRQTSEIETLTRNLNEANARIGELDQEIDSLNVNMDILAEERDVAQDEAVRQANMANVCYYAVGSKQELKSHNVIEGGGFLRKTKIMQGEFDRNFFIMADKRTLTTIPLHSEKAKVLTTYQPSDSYEIRMENGQKVLYITNPASFWGISNYLVVQID